MAIVLPNLDDRTYTDLVDQARALIPQLSPEWTDHNPSDPGIILLELLAWLTEMVIYRVNQVPETTAVTFLQLLNGPDWQLQGELTAEALHAATRETVLRLRERYRAATRDDFEYLTLRQWPQTPAAQALGNAGIIKRGYCLPQRNLELVGAARDAEAPGHVSMLIVPPATAHAMPPQPTETLRQALWRFLDPRRLLTTRLHVVGPDYLRVQVSATLYLEEGVRPAVVRQAVADALTAFFHPLSGGAGGGGWPFGRAVHVSEVYQLLDTAPGVDFVRVVRIKAPDHPEREQPPQADQPITITLNEYELVAIEMMPDSFTTMERTGGAWQKTAE
jgi:hypothetical protein